MAHRWKVREATPADFAPMNRLFERGLGARPATDDDWRFRDDPFGPTIMLVAEDGDRIVGQYGVWPTPLRLGREVCLGAQCIDAVTSAEYQGQGMFTRLASECHEIAASRDIVAIYAVPNSSSRFAFQHRLNFHTVVDLPRWTRLLDPGAHPRIPRAAAPVARAVARLLPTYRDADLRLDTEWPAPDALDALLVEWRAQPGRCAVDRSPAWWQYRLSPRSGRPYYCVSAFRRDALMAIAVWGSDPSSGYPKATLAELIYSDLTAGRAVVGAAVRAARLTGHCVLSAVATEPAVFGVLRANGFLRLRPTPFIVRQLTARTLGANVHDGAAWRIFGADLDTL